MPHSCSRCGRGPVVPRPPAGTPTGARRRAACHRRMGLRTSGPTTARSASPACGGGFVGGARSRGPSRARA
eukprot:2993720-Alexandrium_andersonii.AAC.1